MADRALLDRGLEPPERAVGVERGGVDRPRPVLWVQVLAMVLIAAATTVVGLSALTAVTGMSLPVLTRLVDTGDKLASIGGVAVTVTLALVATRPSYRPITLLQVLASIIIGLTAMDTTLVALQVTSDRLDTALAALHPQPPDTPPEGRNTNTGGNAGAASSPDLSGTMPTTRPSASPTRPAPSPGTSTPRPPASPAVGLRSTEHWSFSLAAGQAVRWWYGTSKPAVADTADGLGGDIIFYRDLAPPQVGLWGHTESAQPNPTYAECLAAARTGELRRVEEIGTTWTVCRAEQRVHGDMAGVVSRFRITDTSGLPEQIIVEVWFEYPDR